MKVRYLTVVVDRGPMEKVPTEIMAHEGPVLESVHGGMDSLKVVGKAREVEVDEIDPEAEYQRLVDKYGIHPDTKTPHVRMAYGALSEGRFAKALVAGPPKKAKAPAPVEDDENEEEEQDEGNQTQGGDKKPAASKGGKGK